MRNYGTFYEKVGNFLKKTLSLDNKLTFPDFTRHFLALLTEPIDTFCLAVLVR